MKFAALGTSEFTMSCINGLIDSGQEVALLVSLPKAMRPDNSVELSDFAAEKGIGYLELHDINALESVAAVQTYSPDVIFSSWPKILRRPAFSAARICVIGFHPTELPFNRGRHPLHWEIVLGLRESKLSFFRMDEGIDTGSILLQVPYEIRAEDTIVTLIARVNEAGYRGSLELGKMLAAGDVPEGMEQDHHRANYWRKRSCHDVTIDFRMSGELIVRTVRSFTSPYPCALLLFEEHVLHVIEAAIARTDFSSEELRRMEPGKIIQVNGCRILVKAMNHIVDLKCQEILPARLTGATYIHPPTKYVAEFRASLALNMK